MLSSFGKKRNFKKTHNTRSRVACETLVSTGMVVVAGEVTTKAYVEIPDVVRETIRDIGYVSGDMAFDYESCALLTSIKRQSPDIALGGAGMGVSDSRPRRSSTAGASGELRFAGTGAASARWATGEGVALSMKPARSPGGGRSICPPPWCE